MALEVPPPETLPLAVTGKTSSTVISVAMLLVSVGFAVAGQITLKTAMDRIGRIGSGAISSPMDTIVKAASQPRLWVGLMLFGISALFWLVVLSRVDLSLAYPFVGISYVVVVALSRFVLHEQVPALRWIGVMVVAIGIGLVGLSSRTVAG